MKTSLFLVSILLGGSLFAQTVKQADQSNSLLKKFNEEAKQQSEAPPISFMENKGQIHDQNYKPRPDVLFGAMAGKMSFHLKTTGVSYQLTRVDSYKEVEDIKTKQTRKEIDQQTIYRIDLSWINANKNFVTTTDKTLEGYNNYYTESCPVGGALNVKSYSGVILHNLYNGIKLHYYEKNGELKHDYIVAAGADYKQIQLMVEGAAITTTEDGSLLLNTPLGQILEGAPLVYQNGNRLKASWVIINQTLSFNIEGYDPNQELIIDPVTRAWGTYYGGGETDYGYSCATDGAGNVFLAGQTSSSTGTIIATTGAHQSAYGGGNYDAFLVKCNTLGVRQWGIYYGGSGVENGTSCSTDGSGNVYLAGVTDTDTGTVIATAGAHQSAYGGPYDAFLVKFNALGVRQWGTYYGGSGIDVATSCSTDGSGNVFLTGQTFSDSGTVIATSGAHQSAYGGNSDAFLVKFNASGVRQWGTYYGGSGLDAGISCNTDGSGNVYMAGQTDTDTGTGIAASGAHQSAYGGGTHDAFLVKFNALGARQWGTYYGGSGIDVCLSSSTDGSGNVYLAGYTDTDTATVIATSGAHQSAYGGETYDAFLVKFNALGLRQWGTYYGGSGSDLGNSCSNDDSGNVYLAGYTLSDTGTVIATAGAHQSAYDGGDEAFLVKFNASGARQWGTYYGGSATDYGYACAADSSGNVYLAGFTMSDIGTVIATTGAHQSAYADFGDAFLVKFVDCIGSSTATVNETACDSYTWALNGMTYTSSGNYTHVGTNANGCPLTTTLNLTINNSSTASVNETACDSYTWALNGTTYTSSGVYTHTLVNSAGCDSIVTLNLTINNSTTATVNQTACDSYTWALTGTTYTSSGNYTHVGTNANGCPLTTTLNLTINNSTAATVNQTACDSYTWPLNGTTYTSSGNYTHVGTNAFGCPLTTTLNLTINNSTAATVNQTACDSYTWALNGMTYTSSGNYTHVGTNANGCPLTTTLNLTINNSTAATVNQTACDSYTWPLNGTTYTSSGTYTHVGTNGSGCLLTTTLNLTINNSSTATVTETVCDSYTWALDGTTYSTSGTYTHVGTNANGCPLTTTLNLTINNSSTATVTQTACDSYTWALNGMTYTSTGNYTHLGTNANGCPLTTTLNLTINNSTTATVTQTACDSYTWALNGTTYTSSGNYTHVGTNANGCPLTTTLNLTINNSTIATVTQTACDSYTWALNGTTYTSSGNYTHVGTNANGCPLTTTLNLTINNSTTATVTETACDSYTWALNGTTYTTSGTYTHVGTNASGCPLTTTLNLTINNSTTATVTETACDSYTWALNGTTYTTSGTYTHVGTNASGCPLTTTLNLTVNTANVSTTVSGITITANASGASYQWINCNNGNAIIPGATAQSYTATANGSYAVIVTNANCTDTSACQVINSVGIDEHNASNITVYPNPTDGNVHVILGKEYQNTSIKLINALGQVILLKTYTSSNEITFEIKGAPGVYFLEIESVEQVLGRIRVVKN